jgi:L-asparaginase
MNHRAILHCTALALLIFGAAEGLARAQPVPVPQASESPRPKVRLIATGGTISNRTGGRLTADELIKSAPALDRYVRAEAEQFANVASAELTMSQWLDLARRINTAFREDGDLAGMVVTSGTDTLEETAYFLNLTVRTDKPVVVVGSMRNPSTLGYGVLGVVDSDRVVYYRTGVKRHTAASEFDVSTIKELPRVDVIMVYQGASGDLIKAAVDHGAKGIVIASAGAGATSGTQREGIEYAVDKRVFVVTSTRTGSGRIAPSRRPRTADGTERADAGYRIGAEDLAPVKARILLMLALAAGADGAAIQRMFSEY